jgi:hypothetical protein
LPPGLDSSRQGKIGVGEKKKTTNPMRPNFMWAERIRPISLNPCSLPILASDLAMFEEAGVKMTVEEFLGSPAAIAALQSGGATIAQLPKLEG